MSIEEPHEPHEPDEQPDEQPVATSGSAPGDPRVDAALRRAGELAATSPTEHVEIYEDVHQSLQEVLADASGQREEPARPESTGPETGDAVR